MKDAFKFFLSEIALQGISDKNDPVVFSAAKIIFNKKWLTARYARHQSDNMLRYICMTQYKFFFIRRDHSVASSFKNLGVFAPLRENFFYFRFIRVMFQNRNVSVVWYQDRRLHKRCRHDIYIRLPESNISSNRTFVIFTSNLKIMPLNDKDISGESDYIF